MARTVDLERRADVMERVTAYVLENGLAGLSLRPLAEAVGISARTLLYHFGSKDRIVVEVLRGIRTRQLALFERLRASEATTPDAICRAAWEYMNDAAVLPALRLFIETYALALREPERFEGFFDGAIEDWLRFLSAPAFNPGRTYDEARRRATIVLAGYRGFMLDFAATGDRARIGAALDDWAASLADRVKG